MQRIRSFAGFAGLSNGVTEAFRKAGAGVHGTAPRDSMPPQVAGNITAKQAEQPDKVGQAMDHDRTVQHGQSTQFRQDAKSLGERIADRRRSFGPVSATRRDHSAERIDMQRASGTWANFLASWLRAGDDVKNGLSLDEVMRSIREQGETLAEYFQSLAGSSIDPFGKDKFVMSATRMVADCVAAIIDRHQRDGGRLSLDEVSRVGKALELISHEVSSRARQIPMPDSVVSQGPTSMAITVAEVSSRILPSLVKYAGLGTSVLMEEVFDLLRLRVSEVVNAILPKDSASWRDRMSLYQSILKREATLMQKFLEELPSAGIGSIASGHYEFREALDKYLSASKVMEDVIRFSLEKARPPAGPAHRTGQERVPDNDGDMAPAPAP